MALLVTLVFGTPFVLYGLEQNTGRAARGLAGAAVWALFWVVGAGLIGLSRTYASERRRGEARVSVRFMVALGSFLGVMGVVLATTVYVLRAGDFGMNPTGFIAARSLLLAAVGVPLAPLLLAWSGRRRPTHAPPVREVLRACAPFLLPALALQLARVLPVSAPLEGRIAGPGISGLLFLQLETAAFPALLLVVWAIDRADGSAGPRAGRVLAVVCAAVLAASSIVPVLVEPEAAFSGTVLLRGGERVPVPLDLDALARATSLMLLACSLVCVQQLARVRRGSAPLAGWRLPALFVLPVAVSVPLATIVGPTTAPLAVALACLLVAATDARGGPPPTVARPPPTPGPARPSRRGRRPRSRPPSPP